MQFKSSGNLLTAKKVKELSEYYIDREIETVTKALILEDAEKVINMYLFKNSAVTVRTVTINGIKYLSGYQEDIEDARYETVYEIRLQDLEGIIEELRRLCPRSMKYSEGFFGIQSRSIYYILSDIGYIKEPQELVEHVLKFFLDTKDDYLYGGYKV